MQGLRSFGLLVAMLLPTLLFSQDQKTDEAAQEKLRRLNAIVEKALADTQNLRLPENRSYFYCQIGSLIWPNDQERATALFQVAADEVIRAQNLAESKRASNPNSEFLNGGSTRQQILNTIASRNAELALDLLVKTRPAAIQRAFLLETNTKISSYSGGNNYLVQNERSMEQNFYRMAAEQSPEHAVKLLEQALSKTLSNETFYQLEKLAEKDRVAANEMASRVVEKLLSTGYIVDSQPLYINIQLTNQILSHVMSRQAADNSKLAFNDSQIRDLANKFISAYISDQRIAPYIGPSAISVAEKFSPASVEIVKKRSAVSNPTNTSELDAAYQKLLEADTPPEQMLLAANKFSIDQRRQIYQSASNKFLARGDPQSARNVLAENFADETRDQLLSNFDMQSVYNLMGAGKFTEAEQVIDGLPEQQRISALINLANSVFSRDQVANKTYAKALLAKAGQLTSEAPENSEEMNRLMQVIGGYSNIEPDEAFRLFEGLVPKINELTDAAAIINGFQANSNVRNGEFVMTQGDPFNNYGANSSVIGTLGRHDFDRVMKLVDSFTRQEMRIFLRLQVAANSGMISNLPIRGRSFSTIFRGSDK